MQKAEGTSRMHLVSKQNAKQAEGIAHEENAHGMQNETEVMQAETGMHRRTEKKADKCRVTSTEEKTP